MADRIKGITVEIGGDTTGLSKALSGVNKEIKSTQSQLKDVERLLKLDPTNTELLKQKQKLLSQAVTETKDKLNALKDAEAQVQEQVKKGEASQEQYDALKREIAATEQSLKDLEEASSKSNATLSQIGAVADEVSEKTGKLAEKTKILSASAAGALAGIAGLTYSAITSADDLNTLAKQTGFTTEELQKMQYAADLVDVSADTITSAAAKMKKNMISTSSTTEEAFEAIGVSVRDSNGELRDSTTVFYDVLEGLSKIENETERDTLAMTIFGKSADSLAGIVDDGGESLKELGEQAEELGLILSQDTLDGLNETNDKIDTMKAKAKATAAEIGAKAADVLLPTIDLVLEKISDVMTHVGNLDEGQIQMILTILAVIAAISPLLSLISKISGGIQTLTTVVIPGLSKAFSFLASNPIVLLIAAIAALAAMIMLKGDEIQAVLQKVDDFLQGIFVTDWTTIFGPVLGNILNGFFANVKNIWDSIKQIFDGIINFIRGAFTGDWERAWTGVKQIFGGIFNGLIAIAKAPLNGVISLLNMAIDGMNSMIGGLNKIHFDVPDWVPGLGGKRFGINIGSIGKIPYLANGGILSQGSAVVGDAGPELLTMLGNRAVVQPLMTRNTTNSYLGGITMYIYGAPGQDVHELADIISEKIDNTVQRREVVFR